MEHYCNICEKKYKNYKSLWKHNYTFHKPIVTNVTSDVTPLVTIVTSVEDNKLKCKYCNKLFARRQGKR